MNKALSDIIADATVQHMSPQRIADSANLDRKTVSSILAGDNTNPKLETLQAVARSLGGDIVYQTTDSYAAIRSGDITYYRTMIMNMQNEIDAKSKWVRVLYRTAIALTATNILLAVMAVLFVSKL